MENGTGEPHVVGTSADRRMHRLHRLETSWTELAAFGADLDSAPCRIEGAEGAGQQAWRGQLRAVHRAARAPGTPVPLEPADKAPGMPRAVFGAGWRLQG